VQLGFADKAVLGMPGEAEIGPEGG
jgi:hypothetical protein